MTDTARGTPASPYKTRRSVIGLFAASVAGTTAITSAMTAPAASMTPISDPLTVAIREYQHHLVNAPSLYEIGSAWDCEYDRLATVIETTAPANIGGLVDGIAHVRDKLNRSLADPACAKVLDNCLTFLEAQRNAPRSPCGLSEIPRLGSRHVE